MIPRTPSAEYCKKTSTTYNKVCLQNCILGYQNRIDQIFMCTCFLNLLIRSFSAYTYRLAFMLWIFKFVLCNGTVLLVPVGLTTITYTVEWKSLCTCILSGFFYFKKKIPKYLSLRSSLQDINVHYPHSPINRFDGFVLFRRKEFFRVLFVLVCPFFFFGVFDWLLFLRFIQIWGK